jgi:Fe-S oxidoreductase/nitrate reductase gamma subunit
MEQPVRESFWNMPQPWTQIILYVVLLVALAVFGYGLYRRVRLWKQGQPSLRFDHVGKRLANVVKYTLGQVKVANDAFPGLMHIAIFAGFVVLFIGTALIFLNDDLIGPIFRWRYMQGGFYLGMETVLDLLGLALVAGLLTALVRRYILRPSRLESRPDDAITLGLLTFIALGGFVQEGLRLAIQNPPWGSASFAGYALGGLFAAMGANGTGGIVAYQILWWVHALAALGFIALIPYTRLFHLVTNPLNAFFYPLTTMAALPAIEGIEECEILGSAQLSHLPQKRLLDYDSCTRCGRCQDVCPAFLAGQPLSPRQVVLDLDSFMLQRGKAPLLGAQGKQFPTEEELELPGGVIAEESLWACTTCMACMERCPVLIDHIGTIVELRRYLSLCSGQMPASVRAALDKTQRAGNPYGTRGGRMNWAEGLGVPLIGAIEDAEVLLWVGCAGAYDPRNGKVLRAVATLLKQAGVRFGVLGDEEQCCGDWARRAGEEYLFQTLAQANIATLKQYKFQAIVTACPHGFNTLRNEYRQFGGEFTVYHHSVYIARLLAEGRLRPTKPWSKGTVAYHDPCYLGRYNGILAEPRQALRTVPGLQIVEPAHHGRQGLCCGGGGGKMWMEEEADKRVNQVRLKEIVATGAEAIGVACPYCLSMLDDAVKVKGLEEKLAVLDVAEIVAGAL